VFSKLRSWPAVAGLIIVAAVLVAAGCGDDNGGSGGGASLDTINSGELRVGSDIPYPPFEFGRAPDYEGFDIDLVNEIAKRLDLEAKFVKTPFDPIFRNLAQGRFDMVASAATITPEREKTIDFSDPYFPADQSLMVKRGSDVKTVDDLAGKTVGSQLGTTGADYAKKKTKAETVRTYDLIDDAFNALQTGQVDAVINDFPTSKYAERSKKDLVVVQTIKTGEEYGLGFATNAQELRRRVNGALQDMKDDDTYTKIYRKWFQVDPPDSIFDTSGSTSG
jgi:polar amino acid transport system substrate-binding protein